MKSFRESDRNHDEWLQEKEISRHDDLVAAACYADAREEVDEPSDLGDADVSRFDDTDWDVFLADDDERDPLPEYGDFWIKDE